MTKRVPSPAPRTEDSVGATEEWATGSPETRTGLGSSRWREVSPARGREGAGAADDCATGVPRSGRERGEGAAAGGISQGLPARVEDEPKVGRGVGSAVPWKVLGRGDRKRAFGSQRQVLL